VIAMQRGAVVFARGPVLLAIVAVIVEIVRSASLLRQAPFVFAVVTVAEPTAGAARG
jgi:hypothetical protein